jgi:hypothetical protein
MQFMQVMGKRERVYPTPPVVGFSEGRGTPRPALKC